MSIAPHPTSSVLSRSLVSVGALLATVVIGISASGLAYLPPAIPAFVGLSAVAGVIAGIAALISDRRASKPHLVGGPALLIEGSVVIIAWSGRLLLRALAGWGHVFAHTRVTFGTLRPHGRSRFRSALRAEAGSSRVHRSAPTERKNRVPVRPSLRFYRPGPPLSHCNLFVGSAVWRP